MSFPSMFPITMSFRHGLLGSDGEPIRNSARSAAVYVAPTGSAQLPEHSAIEKSNVSRFLRSPSGPRPTSVLPVSEYTTDSVPTNDIRNQPSGDLPSCTVGAVPPIAASTPALEKIVLMADPRQARRVEMVVELMQAPSGCSRGAAVVRSEPTG